MALIRAFSIMFAIVGFFVVGAPLQMLIARRAPRWDEIIPRLFCRLLLRLAKVEVSVIGAPTSGAVLLVANHISWIDILALRAVAPVCYLAKAEVSRWPIVSTFAKVQGTVFVDRTRRRSIVAANETMASRMREGRPILLFAEGTTTAGLEPGPFHASHIAAACGGVSRRHGPVAVQPVAIAYSSRTAAWVGDDAMVPHLWQILNGPKLRCRIAFGAPLACSSDTDRKILATAARDAVIGLLSAQPTTIGTDVAASASDARAGVPQAAAGGA